MKINFTILTKGLGLSTRNQLNKPQTVKSYLSFALLLNPLTSLFELPVRIQAMHQKSFGDDKRRSHHGYSNRNSASLSRHHVWFVGMQSAAQLIGLSFKKLIAKQNEMNRAIIATKRLLSCLKLLPIRVGRLGCSHHACVNKAVCLILEKKGCSANVWNKKVTFKCFLI